MSATLKRLPLQDAAAAESRRLAKDPNIVSVGFGLKMVGGQATFDVALHYYVRDKLPSADAIKQRGSEPIADTVEGYKTDVLPWTIARPTACPSSNGPTAGRGTRHEDPLVGGTSTAILSGVSNIIFHYGTLGGICFDASTGDAMAISNAHVWGEDIGAEAIQPLTPALDYVGGTIAWLSCGGPLTNLFTWTEPSPLTDILSTAAAAVWVAAAASDAEDPNRWGQRTSPTPAPGAKTTSERIHLTADLPRLPFPGRAWSAKAEWNYTRNTTTGPISATTSDPRPNQHVLVGKRVYTDQDIYSPGATVRICAQLWTPAGKNDPERFVVAHSFPIHEPARITRRILQPSPLCARLDSALEQTRQPICVHGFPHQIANVAQVNLPLIAAPFVLIGSDSTTLLDPGPGNSSGVTAIRLPKRVLAIACPPSTHVELALFHTGAPVRVRAIAANNSEVDQAVTPAALNVLHRIRLAGPEIVRLELDGRESDAWLAEICVDKRMLNVEKWKGVSNYYTATFPLPRTEPNGKWAVVVVSQSIDDTPTHGDPIAAARKLGGMVDSANMAETGECACEILFDATFDVQTTIIT